MTFLASVIRVVVGIVLACLAAALVQVLFAVTPKELVTAVDDRLGVAANWTLLSATQISVFSMPFALIAATISEVMRLRSFAYHAIVAMAIAAAGFGLIYSNESATEASIVNSYAMAAYLTSGFAGGFIYWLFAGRRAGGSGRSTVRMETDRKSPVVARPPVENKATPQGSTGTVPATKPPPPKLDGSAEGTLSS
jgi:hypothetical protein